MTDYATRYRDIRDALAALDPREVAATLPPGYVDQVTAAGREAYAALRRVGEVEHALDPRRFGNRQHESNDRDATDDILARVLAAMGDGTWTLCPHLRRTPAQPAHVQLALRRTVCHRCTHTARKPPPGEADRCDLCGTRGHVTFWPVRFAVVNLVVLGDMCTDCAHQVHALMGVSP